MFKTWHEASAQPVLQSYLFASACALDRGTKEFMSIRRPFAQQASGFQVVCAASKMAISHYSCFLIHNELSTYERRQ